MHECHRYQYYFIKSMFYTIAFFIEVQYDLRLVDGENENDGRLEIQISGVWGTVCDDFWEYTDADIACRQLGFSKALLAQSRLTRHNALPILLYNLNCSGSESFIWDCPTIEYGVVDKCYHDEDVNLVCLPNGNNVYVDKILSFVELETKL